MFSLTYRLLIRSACCAIVMVLPTLPQVGADEKKDLRQEKIAAGEAKREYLRALKRRDRPAAREALKEIGQLNTTAAAEYLASLEEIHSELYDELVEALASISDPDAQARLLKIYKKAADVKRRNWYRQVLLIDAFGQQQGEPGADALKLAVQDAHSKVRLAAIRALEDGPRPLTETVPILIESLKSSELTRDHGTPHIEARKTLARLTGVDRQSAKSWHEFWKDSADHIVSLDKEELTSIDITGDAIYYGETVTSWRVLFVIDTSHSMLLVDFEGWPDTPKEKIKTKVKTSYKEGGQVGIIKNKKWNQWILANPECKRLRRAQGEMHRLIKAMPPGTAFNILSFDSKVDRWQSGLTPAAEPAKKSAVKFISKLEAKGATAADLALAEAFKKNDAADTIYFLSDGEPTRDGKPVPIKPILDRIKEANRYRRIIIHTLGFGVSPERFLKPLAEQNGGTYHQIVGPPKIQEKDEKEKKAKR